ncbi:unnamed protein product [Mytilus coruscus]|uniref:CCHC-type domain-containing protein n=1 Tax=Mytilus coruscus TaxID=42192 RepID=A0A6J8AMZ0_MYTCO|nr:unnamed protein product [Mytilus coruscus]
MASARRVFDSVGSSFRRLFSPSYFELNSESNKPNTVENQETNKPKCVEMVDMNTRNKGLPELSATESAVSPIQNYENEIFVQTAHKSNDVSDENTCTQTNFEAQQYHNSASDIENSKLLTPISILYKNDETPHNSEIERQTYHTHNYDDEYSKRANVSVHNDKHANFSRQTCPPHVGNDVVHSVFNPYHVTSSGYGGSIGERENRQLYTNDPNMDEMKENSFNTQERLFYEQCNKNTVQVPDEYSSELRTKTVSSNEKMGYFDPKGNTNITNNIQEITSAKGTAKHNVHGHEYEVPEYQPNTTYQNMNKMSSNYNSVTKINYQTPDMNRQLFSRDQDNTALNYRDQTQTRQNYQHANDNCYFDQTRYSNEATHNKNYNPIQTGCKTDTEFQTNKHREYPPYLREQLNRREQFPVNLSKLPGSWSSRYKRKEKDPDTYNGINVEWPDYICHFEQVAMWNEWTDQEKAAQLSICLRGNAQRVLSELTKSELSDYNKLRSALTQRFCPPERETAFRCEFRTRRRSRDESAAEYGGLKRLASHAYPQIPMSMRESLVIEQYVSGLGNAELKRHVQFSHPSTLDKAISLAVEFEAFEGTQNSQYRKPKPEEAVNIFAVQNTHTFETNKNTHVEPSIWELADSVKAIQQTLANFTQGQQSDFNQVNNTRPRDNKITICYTCQKEGHISKYCPEASYRRQDNNNYNRNRRANNQRQPQNTHSDDLK